MLKNLKIFLVDSPFTMALTLFQYTLNQCAPLINPRFRSSYIQALSYPESVLQNLPIDSSESTNYSVQFSRCSPVTVHP